MSSSTKNISTKPQQLAQTEGKTLSNNDLAASDCSISNLADDDCDGNKYNDKVSDEPQVVSGTLQIGGLKGTLTKIVKEIKSILESKDYEASKKLISLKRNHEKAHEKCVKAINNFCSVLEPDSPKIKSYNEQVETLNCRSKEIIEQIDEFLLAAVEVASSIRSSRKSKTKCQSEKSSSTATTSASKRANVQIMELRLKKAQQEQIITTKAAELESERAILQAELDLAEAQVLVEEEQQGDEQSQCLSDLNNKALTAHDRVVEFLNEASNPIAATAKRQDEVNCGKTLRPEAPSWHPQLRSNLELAVGADNVAYESGYAPMINQNMPNKHEAVDRHATLKPHYSDRYGSAKVNRSPDQDTNLSANLTTDELARLIVRCKDPPTASFEDRFDGDPAKYHRFILQFRDTVLNQYERTDPAHALVRLYAATRGRARKIVEACQMEECPGRALNMALEDLKEAFGAPQLQVDAKLKEICEGPIIKLTADSLQDFYVSLISCRNLLISANVAEELDAPSTTEKIFRRLPLELQRRFVRFSVDRGYQIRRIPFNEVLKFIKTCRDEFNSNFGRLLETVGAENKNFYKVKTRSGRSNAVHVQETSPVDEQLKNTKPGRTSKERICTLCMGKHGIWKCKKFLDLPVPERRSKAKSLRLCFCCLGQGHLFKDCTSRFRCQRCEEPHHTLLHVLRSPAISDLQMEPKFSASSSVTNSLQSKFVASSENNLAATVLRGSRPRTRLKVLPVLVKNKETGTTREVLAFLDGGADCHLMTRQLFEELGVKGKPVKSCIGLANGTSSVEETVMADLLVGSLGQPELHELSPVIVKNKLADVSSSVPMPQDIARNPHLEDVNIPVIERTSVDLIIGLSARILHEILEKREAGADKLCAGRCLLGWFLYGNDDTVEEDDTTQHACFVSSLGSLASTYNNEKTFRPEKIVDRERYEEECLVCIGSGKCENCGGTGNRRSQFDSDLRAPSINDDRAQAILDNTCTLVDGHYQIGLLWAADNPELPDNFTMAKARLDRLGKRLKCNPEVKGQYRQKIDAMVQEGHAVEVHDRSSGATPGKTFYIPHHNISSKKFRIVMDCAAPFKGVSLNSTLLTGPDNFNSLLGVLFRFRFNPVAIVADIQNMFFQVKCDPADRSALRFLFWEDGDPDKEVKIYQSTVHCFGLTCSPCIANYALTRTAVDNSAEFSKIAVMNVKHNFYVDDWLTSVKDTEQATALVKEVDELLSRGGFRLMKFSSNEPEVFKNISPERLSPHLSDVELQRSELTEQKSLGVIWEPGEDRLKIKIADSSHAWTRRGFLSFESAIFDPLGIIAPFKLPAKIILQQLTKAGLDWDDREIPLDIKRRWQKWANNLCRLNGVSLLRCHPGLSNAKFVELHCFADASKIGYGIVYYLRIFDGENCYVSFILGKSKVLPATCNTTPRAELHAALELVEFSRVVVREHSLNSTSEIFFWSDSQTVLGYLKNSSKRLPIFEANRVKRILSGSLASQWQWIDTARNPADFFSRGVSPSRPTLAQKWLCGPSFLSRETEQWKIYLKRRHLLNKTTLTELKPNISAAACLEEKAKDNSSPICRLITHYSTLSRLLRAVSWWRRIICNLYNRIKCNNPHFKRTTQTGFVTVSEYKSSLLLVIRIAQTKSLPGVLEALETSNCHDIDTGKFGDLTRRVISPIRAYCPFVKDGVIRIGGRLQKSNLSYDEKHPIVLPRRHHVTGLIVVAAHVKCGHFAVNYVLNELLTKYHILGGRATIKYYINRLCIECRNRNAKVCSQQMAPLPTGRVTVRQSPFEHCGVDYLCGLKVKQGRNELKRYGCVFTCLATRATHLEIVFDLSTEAFLMALRRFLALTGSRTRVLYSDNGSNFHGAEAELKRGLQRLQKKWICDSLAVRGVEFRFNPPLASHQGGVFESIIRLVRKVMTALMDDQKLRTLTDDGLETLFREIQMILNNRPLTRVSADADDTRALTPNSILTGSIDPAYPPDVFVGSDGLRASYRLTQAYTEEFWRRFIAEYVPTLNKRKKWLAPQRNLKVGDLVLLHGEPAIRYQYARAIVTDVQPDKFGQVRRVTVRDAEGRLLSREVAKISLLEGEMN